MLINKLLEITNNTGADVLLPHRWEPCIGLGDSRWWLDSRAVHCCKGGEGVLHLTRGYGVEVTLLLPLRVLLKYFVWVKRSAA